MRIDFALREVEFYKLFARFFSILHNHLPTLARKYLTTRFRVLIHIKYDLQAFNFPCVLTC